jgi:cytochrome c556
MSKRLVLAAIAASFLSGPAAAQDAEGVAEARIAYYALMGADMGVLSGMARQEIPYDAASAQAHADNLVLLSRYAREHLYAEGTSNADIPGKTRAQPAIWSDWEGYLAREGEFNTAAAAVAEVADDGLPALQEAMTQLGGTCRTCHQAFRAQDF